MYKRQGIDCVKENGILTYLLGLINLFNSCLCWLINKLGYIFFKLNRLIGFILIFTYLGIKIYKFHKVMKGSTLTHNTSCKEKISEFGLKRKVRIYINNSFKTPLTFGILRPRIILPVSYTHLTLPTIAAECRSRWSPCH